MLVLLDRNKGERQKRRGRMGRLQKMYFSSPQEGYGTTSESPAISVAPTMTWRNGGWCKSLALKGRCRESREKQMWMMYWKRAVAELLRFFRDYTVGGQ